VFNALTPTQMEGECADATLRVLSAKQAPQRVPHSDVQMSNADEQCCLCLPALLLSPLNPSLWHTACEACLPDQLLSPASVHSLPPNPTPPPPPTDVANYMRNDEKRAYGMVLAGGEASDAKVCLPLSLEGGLHPALLGAKQTLFSSD